MKQILKCILVFSLVFLLANNNTIISYASSEPDKAVYDFEKGGTQTFHVLNEDGTYDEIIIKEIQGVSRLENGSYKVSYKASAWTAGFYISVSNNKITNAYSAFHTCHNGTIEASSLSKNSSTKASYSFVHKIFLLNINTGVVATISNSTLQVTKK